MAFVGIDTVVFGAPDIGRARNMFSDWGLNKLRGGVDSVVFETGIGSQVIVREEDTPQLPPRLSCASNFR
ncbi:MAG TPA: glyoxalase, partial [Burkholderiales bacterium]|nr:glyoxalase [Burkholderiales bacterium]